MKSPRAALLGLLLGLALPAAEPPFAGTAYISRDILTPKDPTAFVSLEDLGQGQRVNFDRRSAKFGPAEVWLFRATYKAGRPVEVQVNREFPSQTVARRHAERYARILGQLPHCLRRDVDALWIHDGEKPFGGGNRSVLIHVGQGEALDRKGTLEEVMLHEACHTSLDADHARAPAWAEARAKDPVAISRYALEHPLREDVAETFPCWFAVRHRRDRLPRELVRRIETSVPARLAYFDAAKLELSPP